MHIERLDFENSPPYLGVYGRATDRVLLLREGLGEKKLEVLREVLKVPIIETSIMKSRIVGIFAAGNSNAIIVLGTSGTLSLRESKLLSTSSVLTWTLSPLRAGSQPLATSS